MKINSNTHRLYRLQQALFYLLLIAAVTLLAKLSIDNNFHSDWTANNRHTLSNTTIDFLTNIETPIAIQIFISPSDQYRPSIEALITRYQSHTDKLNVNYINPDFSPVLVRQYNIVQQGEMVVSLGERQEHIFDLSEQSLTNALISVLRNKQQWLVFIEGHGERSPLNNANFNLSIWAEQLSQKGFKFRGLNLVNHSQIPDNTAAVVIASPESAWLAGEIEIIKDYIHDGGDLLWLSEPSEDHTLSDISELLDIEFISGTVIDPNSEVLGIDDPRFVLINNYANHPVGKAISTVTLFPQAVALEPSTLDSQWLHTALLTSQENTWSDTDISDGPTNFDQGYDTLGPLSIGFLLTRSLDEKNDLEQRIAVIGDGDFVSNSYIGNAGNLDLGMALLNWLVQDDDLIAIPVKTTLDNTLNLSPTQSLIIGLGFLIILPILLLSIGFSLWWFRRRR